MNKPLSSKEKLRMLREHLYHCPVCQVKLFFIRSHPNYLCKACAARITDATGRKLLITNQNITGGILARYIDSHKAYPTPICYVDGIKCIAREVRMGGIAIEKYFETETTEAREGKQEK